MSDLPAIDIDCPYCGEVITLFVDESAGDQDYIEDCQVCCRPIEIAMRIDEEGAAIVHVRSQDDA